MYFLLCCILFVTSDTMVLLGHLLDVFLNEIRHSAGLSLFTRIIPVPEDPLSGLIYNTGKVTSILVSVAS